MAATELLDNLAIDDLFFQNWAEAVREDSPAQQPNSCACVGSVSPQKQQWQLTAFDIARHLIASPRWQSNLPEHMRLSGELLANTAHLVIRNRALEGSYCAQLDSAKSKAIYNFAYGLSHELNNPLANVATRAGVLLEKETEHQRRVMLTAIVDNAMRGCEMLGDLMLVARPPTLSIQDIDVSHFVLELAAKAKQYSKPLSIVINTQIDDETPKTVAADSIALTETLWCLVRNSLEAMPDGGNLCIRTTERDSCLQMEVLDNGPGLSTHALENCFDPYFSGREAGRGLGLGLTKARRIVELHHGQLSLSNRGSGGCRASILIPTNPPTATNCSPGA